MTRTAPFFRFETAPRDFRSWVYALALGLALVMPILQRVQGVLPTNAAAESGYRVSDNYKTDAYGVELATSGVTSNAYRFAGEQFDFDLGMTLLRSRYLDPRSGRFWTWDSYEAPSSDPNSLHKYLYANNVPTNYLDPSGQGVTLGEALTAVSVIGVVANQVLGTWKLLNGDYEGARSDFISSIFWGVGLVEFKGISILGKWSELRKSRQIYNAAVVNIERVIRIMQETGKAAEVIAPEVVKLRNLAKITARGVMKAADVAALEARNLREYGDKIGPTVEWYLSRNYGYQEIVQSATKPNFWYNLFLLSF